MVKTIDISKKYIEIDFQNVTVVGGTDKSRVEQKVKGNIGSSVIFRD